MSWCSIKGVSKCYDAVHMYIHCGNLLAWTPLEQKVQTRRLDSKCVLFYQGVLIEEFHCIILCTPHSVSRDDVQVKCMWGRSDDQPPSQPKASLADL